MAANLQKLRLIAWFDKGNFIGVGFTAMQTASSGFNDAPVTVWLSNPGPGGRRSPQHLQGALPCSVPQKSETRGTKKPKMEQPAQKNQKWSKRHKKCKMEQAAQ
jgi:hypothetical protein